MSKLTKRTVPVLILTVLALSIIPAVMPVMALTAPTLENTKSPWVGLAEGDKGDTVVVTGKDGELPAGSAVKLYWDSLEAWDGEKGLLNTTEAEASGNYEVWFDVPEATAGNHYVWVKSEALDEQASTAFFVHSLVKLSPDSGLVGDKVSVKGYGFAKSCDAAIAGFDTIATSVFEFVGTGDGVKAEFSLDYWPVVKGTLTVTLAVYGIQVEDTDYAVNYALGKIEFKSGHEPPLGIDITATYDYYPGISETTSNTVGTFSKTVTVPTGAVGTESVWGVDNKGNVDDATFTVGPVITLTPEAGPVGSIVRVRGRGFTANGEIDPTYPDSHVGLWRGLILIDDCYIIDAPISIDSDSEFMMDIVIPKAPKVDDNYEVRVVDEAGVSATEDFEVTGLAKITVDPEFGAQGEPVTIHGYNFTAISGNKVTITLGGVDVGITPKTDAKGEFSGTFTVPAISSGVHVLRAEQATYNIYAMKNFNVGLMIVILSPSEGPTGELVIITGSGFTPFGKWSAKFDDITLFEDMDVDAAGTFSETFYVPMVDVGIYTVSVMDIDSEIELTAEFEVTTIPVIIVYVDIKPGSWPNPLNLKSKGVLPIAVCGTEDFDVMTIDPTTVMLSIEGVEEGVYPLRWSYEDVATPYTGEPGGGHEYGGDGYMDLTLKFSTRELIETLGLDGFKGETIPIILTGNLKEEFDNTPIQGQDYVWILPHKGKGKSK